MNKQEILKRIENILEPELSNIKDQDLDFFINHIVINIQEAIYTYNLLKL